MIDEARIKDALQSVQAIVADDDELRVTTQCLYPTNNLVRISIRGGTDTFVVSDMGGAVRAAASVGLPGHATDRAIANIVRKQGLVVANGTIACPPVALSDLGAAAVMVANASKEVADWCFDTFKFKHQRNFKKMLAELMKTRFGDELKTGFPVTGKSSKRHFFEYAITSADRILLIDSVLRDSASVNSRVVANLDVRQIGDARFSQFVIYDDADEWPPSDLMLLKMAAPIIPFSRADAETRSWANG